MKKLPPMLKIDWGRYHLEFEEEQPSVTNNDFIAFMNLLALWVQFYTNPDECKWQKNL